MTNRATIIGDASCNTVEIGDLVGDETPEITLLGQNARVLIEDGVKVGNLKLRLESDASIVIGQKSTFQGAMMIASQGCSITIGRDCMFSFGVTIRTSDGHPLTCLTTGKILNPPQSVSLGDHVWVGQNAQLLRGANIPHECVIGMGSLVKAGSFSANSTIAGVPAKEVGTGTRWLRNWDDTPEELMERLGRPAV